MGNQIKNLNDNLGRLFKNDLDEGNEGLNKINE